MRYFAFLLLYTILLNGCQTGALSDNRQFDALEKDKSDKRFSQLIIKEETDNPKIIISSYTLITDDEEARRADAEAVMRVKKNFPLAVMTKDRALFERILARDFVFRGEGENGLLRREDYINNRVQATGVIELVKYENMVLQFFGEIAVVTYRNVLKNKDASGQPDDTEYIPWADVYVKEDGEWKIGAAHVIDYRTEKQ